MFHVLFRRYRLSGWSLWGCGRLRRLLMWCLMNGNKLNCTRNNYQLNQKLMIKVLILVSACSIVDHYPLSLFSFYYLFKTFNCSPPSFPSAAARIEKRLSYCSSPASPPPFIFPPAPFSLLPTTVLLSRTDLLSTVLSDINYIAQQGRLAECHGHYLE